MSRTFPGSLGDNPSGLITSQRGLIVRWGGEDDVSHIYSPVSGIAVLPPCFVGGFARTDKSIACHLDYGMLFGPEDANAALVVVTKEESVDQSPVHPPQLGDFLEYDAIPYGDEGMWAAINVRFTSLRFRMVPHLKKWSLQVVVRAVVNRVDAAGYEPVAWMWNDHIGRIYVPPLYYSGLTTHDEVVCTASYRPEGSFKYGGEDIVWWAVAFHSSESPADPDGKHAVSVQTSDGWKVTSNLTDCAMCTLVNERSCETVYAGWNDFIMDYESLRIDIGSMCRVSYVKQLGSGIPFLRAILVTPLNEEGLPIDVGMIEN